MSSRSFLSTAFSLRFLATILDIFYVHHHYLGDGDSPLVNNPVSKLSWSAIPAMLGEEGQQPCHGLSASLTTDQSRLVRTSTDLCSLVQAVFPTVLPGSALSSRLTAWNIFALDPPPRRRGIPIHLSSLFSLPQLDSREAFCPQPAPSPRLVGQSSGSR